MSLPPAKTQGSLFDVSFLMTGLFDAKNRYLLFRERILPALYDAREALCALYCEENGRPAIDPVIAAGVTLLQFMEKRPDRQAAEMVKLHLGWKYALNLELGYEGFHHTSLVKFRNRLVEGGAERVGFDALLEALRSAGLIGRGGKQRLDSTHVLGAVAKMGRLQVVRETIRLFLESVRAHDSMERLPGWETFQALYLDSQIAWHRLSKAGLNEKSHQAGRDALALIRWVRMQPACLRQSDKALLLERVFLEQYELDTDEPQRRKADEFDVDVANRTAVCPAGHPSRQCSRLENQRTGEVDYRFEWADLCDDCPLQKQCTKSRSGRRMVVVGEHHDDLQQRRREMHSDEFKQRMHQRNAIEGTISEFVRGGGRRTRYRGLPKTTLANYFRGAAVNANRLIKLTQSQNHRKQVQKTA